MITLLTSFIGRLSVGHKLTLIYFLDLSAVIFVSGILINEKFIAIDFARKELLGSHYIAAVRDTLFTYSSAPDSASSLPPRLLAAQTELGGEMGSAELAERLAGQLAQAAPADLIDVIRSTQALITRIGNQSNLILDPDLDSYYTMSLVVLRFPELFEVTDLIRGKATEWTLTPKTTRQSILSDYLLLEGRLDGIAKGIESDFSEAIAAMRPDLRENMAHERDELLAAINTYRESARFIVADNLGGSGKREMKAASGIMLEKLATTWTTSSKTLDSLLASRVEGLFHRMWMHLGTAVALLLLILSAVFFVARHIATPVGLLADLAEKVSRTGDYLLRAHWDSADELGRLVTAFNRMLEQLDKSRLSEQEMIASMRAAAAQRELLEAISIPLMVTSIPSHNVLHANAPAQLWLEGCTSDPWASGLLPETRVRFFQQLSYQDAVNEFEVQWQGQQATHWALLSARRLRYQDKDAVLTTFAPINSLKALERRLELWSKVFEATSELIIVTDAARNFVTVNRAFYRGTGHEPSDLNGMTLATLCSDRHPEAFIDDIWRKTAVHGSWKGELWIRRKSGEDLPLWAALNTVRDAQGLITQYIIVALDISEQKISEQRISHLAHHDGLTDLPNRLLCLERLRMALQQAERLKTRVGVLFIDLDRFKNINDSLGHHVGDGLLRSVSKSLLKAVRIGDTVSRLGGDEFVVILNGVADVTEIAQIVDERLIPLTLAPHQVDDNELFVSCSVGIAVYPDDGDDIDTLMRNADAAMYQAKSSGRNNAQFFTREMDLRARERLNIETELRHALERQEIRLFYQPRVDCRSGRLLGTEALARWQHPERGLIPPLQFIPIAEESGLIVPIGVWIIGEACRQQSAWRHQGVGDILISINISAAQLRDPELVPCLQSALLTWKVDPAKIELELTETLLMEDVPATIDLLNKLKALGISLSVDDFGTGYSSLNYLHRFPIDKLKIDKSFVSNMLADSNNLAITRTIISLGHTLGLKVVAEGVEHEEEARMLAAAGCDELQGYLFSKPLPASEFADWVRGGA
jgi:diguanylate cyclase (GGDEF)-like protein/PAS domain S-box-containing protein